MGKRYNEDKQRIFERADIFIHPTMDDCFPLVLLEAMQNGIPIISTRIGGILDIVVDGENGFLCDNISPQSLSLAIVKLIKDKELLCKMSIDNSKRFRENYTQIIFEKRMCQILNELIN